MAEICILVIEDEEDIRELIHFHLFKQNYKVLLAQDGQEGLNLARENKPDLILLDLMLPKLDGMGVCSALKQSETTRDIPIIMVTAKGEENDIVKGLEMGADDYIVKPFGPKVLMARVKTALRRTENAHSNENMHERELEHHGISVDQGKRKVFLKGDELSLTYSEFMILTLLMKKSGWVFTRSQIVDSVRGDNHAITDRSVDVQIVGLRKKLGEAGDLIETVRGVGYRFKE